MESGEWREVRRRGVGRPSSERFPVRHSKLPSHRFTPKPQTFGFRNGYSAIVSQPSEFHLESSSNDTFFFNNFPEGCWLETLYKSFNKVGKVLDVFCPRKRDLRGKPFGFVRFEKGLDTAKVLADLNNIWFGSYKLRAYIPRFDRSPRMPKQTVGDGEQRSKDQVGRSAQVVRSKVPVQIPESRRVAGQSFLDTLTGNTKLSDSAEDGAEVCFEFQSNAEEKNWLLTSFTGSIKKVFCWEEVKDEIRSECDSLIKITSLGGNLVLIQSLSQISTQEVLKELDEWTSFWFDWLRPWKTYDVNSQRIVWTKWHGVPLHAWNQRFFEVLGPKLGQVLRIHDDTIERTRLDVAAVQISTGLNLIDNFVTCKIDGDLFNIRVVECGDNFLSTTEEFGGDSSESEFSEDDLEEDRLSCRPAEAQIETDGDVGESSDGVSETLQEFASNPTKICAVFPSPEVNSSKKDPTRSLECQEPPLESHAHSNYRDPLRSIPRTDVEYSSDTQEANPNFEVVGPSSLGLGILGPGPVQHLSSPETHVDCVCPNIEAGPNIPAPKQIRPNLSKPIVFLISAPLQSQPKQFSEIDSSISERNAEQIASLFPHRKKSCGDFLHRAGFRRFVQYQMKSKFPKVQQRRGLSVDGRASARTMRTEEKEGRTHRSRDVVDIEVNSSSPDPQLLEGFKMWNFGKKLGFSSVQDDIILAMNLGGVSRQSKRAALGKAHSV